MSWLAAKPKPYPNQGLEKAASLSLPGSRLRNPGTAVIAWGCNYIIDSIEVINWFYLIGWQSNGGSSSLDIRKIILWNHQTPVVHPSSTDMIHQPISLSIHISLLQGCSASSESSAKRAYGVRGQLMKTWGPRVMTLDIGQKTKPFEEPKQRQRPTLISQ